MREQIDVDNINRQLQLYDWSKSLTSKVSQDKKCVERQHYNNNNNNNTIQTG